MLKKLIILYILIQGHHVFATVEKQEAVSLISKIAEIMNPIAIDQGLEVKLQKEIGAFSKWEKRNKIGLITFDDRLFQVKKLDMRAVAMITCHEFGHFLGGAPTIQLKPNGTIFTVRNVYENMSVEGQADFFATSVCAPKVEHLLEQTNFDPILESFCIGKREDCLSTLMGIRSAADTYIEILASQNYHTSYSDLFDVSHFITDRILNFANEYPSMQCRVQTMVQGLSCFEILEDGNCLNENEQTIELRPRCWFKENR